MIFWLALVLIVAGCTGEKGPAPFKEDTELDGVTAPLKGTGSVGLYPEFRIKFHQTLQTNVFGVLRFLSPAETILDLLNCRIRFETTTLTNDTVVMTPVFSMQPSTVYRGLSVQGFQAVSGSVMEPVTLSNFFFVTDVSERKQELPAPPMIHTLPSVGRQVELRWDPVPGAAAYAVFRSRGRVWWGRRRIAVVTDRKEPVLRDQPPGYETWYYSVHAISSRGDWSPPSEVTAVAKYPSGVILRLDRVPRMTELYPFPRNSYYARPELFFKVNAGASRSGISLNTKLSAGFRLKEFLWNNDVQAWDNSEKAIKIFGYAFLDPAAIAGLERIRKRFGRIRVSSGFRSPERNGAIGGATHSRHMFGDAFDILVSGPVAWTNLRNIAEDEGADFIEPYTMTRTWLHCDWRYNN